MLSRGTARVLKGSVLPWVNVLKGADGTISSCFRRRGFRGWMILNLMMELVLYGED